MRSASLRPAPSRSRSPSRWRAPESSPAARPATDLRRALWRASASPRCGGAGLPAPLPACRTGTDGSRLQSRLLPCPPLGRRVDPLIVEAVELRRHAANSVEAVAPRRRSERAKDETLRVPPASQLLFNTSVQIRLTRAISPGPLPFRKRPAPGLRLTRGAESGARLLRPRTAGSRVLDRGRRSCPARVSECVSRACAGYRT